MQTQFASYCRTFCFSFLELIEESIPVGTIGTVLTRLLVVAATVAVFYHSLYLLDRLFLALANEESPLYLSLA